MSFQRQVMSVHCVVESNARLNETTALRTLRTDVTTHCSTLLPSLFKHRNDQSLLHPADLAQDNTKGCQHCPLKQRRSHKMPSLRHIVALTTLMSEGTTHCSTPLPAKAITVHCAGQTRHSISVLSTSTHVTLLYTRIQCTIK